MKIKLELFPERLKLIDDGKRWNGNSGSLRKDVYIPAALNGLEAEVHLMTSDGSIKENKNKWYCSFECNTKNNNHERCCKCQREIAMPLALDLFPQLKKMGYPIALWHDSGFWIFNVGATLVESLPDKTSRRQFFYKRVDRINCPIHGTFVQETEESVF